MSQAIVIHDDDERPNDDHRMPLIGSGLFVIIVMIFAASAIVTPAIFVLLSAIPTVNGIVLFNTSVSPAV